VFDHEYTDLFKLNNGFNIEIGSNFE